jgi:hypothetical protein
VPSPSQSAIEYFPGPGKKRRYFADHDRRMVGSIPPAGQGIGHLQKRFTSLSTAGVNCGMAVRS